MHFSSTATRAAAALAALAALCGCGSSSGQLSGAQAGEATTGHPHSCQEAALEVLGDVARRIYHEGVASERTVVAERMIAGSTALRGAVERRDPAAARAAAQKLVATGRLTNLQVSGGAGSGGRATGQPLTGGRVLADVGAPGALAPLHGTIVGASGAPIGSFVASVWSDAGLIGETDGIAEALVALRRHGHEIAGSISLPRGGLPAKGRLRRRGVTYQYTSYPAEAYPSGSVRVYVLRPLASIKGLCGRTIADTVANTATRVARLIYAGEAGERTLGQIHRVQHDRALLSAVARRNPTATRAAIDRLLTEHIVRLRVSAGGRLLADVGGPYVLAPVGALLRLHGRPIGSFVLSIQDDEGYLRLARRLAGLDVLMYMGSRLVKNSLGPPPSAVPADGSYRYHGRNFRVVTLHASAFPSGPLRIVVLIPFPYS